MKCLNCRQECGRMFFLIMGVQDSDLNFKAYLCQQCYDKFVSLLFKRKDSVFVIHEKVG